MRINDTFIFFKKIKIILELINIAFGINISLKNSIILFNALLFTALVVSFIEQIFAVYCLQRYNDNIGREFDNNQEFEIWERRSIIFYFKLILSYLRISLYVVLSILTIRYFEYLNTILIKTYFVIIICQVILFFLYHYYKNTCSCRRIVTEVPNTSSNIYTIIEIKKIGALDDECSICLDKNNEEWCSIPCDHKFHKECVLQWLEINKTCPICRKALLENDLPIIIQIVEASISG